MTTASLTVRLIADLEAARRRGLRPEAMRERLAALAGWACELRRQIEADPLLREIFRVEIYGL